MLGNIQIFLKRNKTIDLKSIIKSRSFLFILINFLYYTVSFTQTVYDNEGNVYNTIQIGTQEWMRENLKTGHFNNGDLIPTTFMKVNNDSSSLFQWTYDNDTNYLETFGRLYTWFAANNYRGVCPENWHVPNDSDWFKLANFLGGIEIAGGKMKDTGLLYWQTTDTNVNNVSKFTALPGGFRGNSYVFNNLYKSASFWSSEITGNWNFLRGNVFYLQALNNTVIEGNAVANCGMSVRCIKNSSSSTINLNEKEYFDFNLYPKPSTGILNISISGVKPIYISVFTISGTLLYTSLLQDENNIVDLGFLTSGIYLIRFWNNELMLTEKFSLF